MNYCCAMGNCPLCVERFKHIRAYNRAVAKRLRRYGPPPPPTPQLKTRDEVTREFK
jgi:hypothetical protein